MATLSEHRQQRRWWERRWWERALGRLASTPVGGWFYVHVAPSIDRRLVRSSQGRINTTGGGLWPVTLLTAIGAKNGQPRTTPLLYFNDDGDVVVIASNGGRPFNPAWYHNLRANPEAALFINGRTMICTAREAAGSERERLWAKAVDLFRGYEVYQRRTRGRQIPVIVLTPKSQR
jgi:deazaflavin-dependent oxidoreductase (nitroreductase family)